MATCKAVIQEGSRKGNNCMFPPSDNAYCGRHQRNRIYDEGIAEGKKWCRYFFRGCDTYLTNDEILKKEVSCKPCRDKIKKKKFSCEHEACTFKVHEEGYCKKHERDIYRKEEKEKGIRYCDIARGCFTICLEGKHSCEECLGKNRIIDSARYAKRKELTQVLQTTNSTKRICTHCGNDFESFNTRYNKDSLSCKDCSSKQLVQDEKRKNRIRNYKEESNNNITGYYKDYIIRASKKGLEIRFDFDDFSKLVTSSCYYCNHKSDLETIGIDRVDNSKGYILENCVPCCWNCNRIKHVYHQEFFIEKCKIMIKNKEPRVVFFKQWQQYYYRSCFKNLKAYIKDAESRNIPFELSEQQWNWLVRSPCYLCGYQSVKGIGIDRVDNTIRKYSIDNCRPCCGSCNNMKGEFTLEEFLNQCTKIVNTWDNKKCEAVPMPEDPLKTVISKGGLMPAEERKHWKGLGLYYAIISDSADKFLEDYSTVYSADDYIKLCNTIKTTAKEESVKILQTLLQTLKKRKHRAG